MYANLNTSDLIHCILYPGHLSHHLLILLIFPSLSTLLLPPHGCHLQLPPQLSILSLQSYQVTHSVLLSRGYGHHCLHPGDVGDVVKGVVCLENLIFISEMLDNQYN